MMSIVITGSPTKFSSDRTCLQHSQLAFQTVNEYHHLFTQASRRSRLSMSFSKHRDVSPLRCISFQLCNQFLNQRIINFIQRFFDRKRHRRIVNILRSQSEVNEFFIVIHSTQLVKFFFQEIFYSFYIMVGYTLDIFNTLRICFRKITVDIP